MNAGTTARGGEGKPLRHKMCECRRNQSRDDRGVCMGAPATPAARHPGEAPGQAGESEREPGFTHRLPAFKAVIPAKRAARARAGTHGRGRAPGPAADVRFPAAKVGDEAIRRSRRWWKCRFARYRLPKLVYSANERPSHSWAGQGRHPPLVVPDKRPGKQTKASAIRDPGRPAQCRRERPVLHHHAKTRPREDRTLGKNRKEFR
jgi:hypothetical protein